MINLTIREQLALALYQEGFFDTIRKFGDRLENPGKIGDDISKAKDKFVALNKKAWKKHSWNKHTNSDSTPTTTTKSKSEPKPKQEQSKTVSSDSNYHQAGELDGRIKSKPKPNQDPYYHRAGELDDRPSKTKPKQNKPDPNKKSEGFTGAHAVGATMLATGIGLGAHSLYKKWKKKKKEKELRNKKY